ncbi:MAG: V-type ATP synthase subunit I [Nanoarchaeota archaeon]
MSSVIITGPNNILETIIKELHNLKVLHIVEHSKNELADIGRPLDKAGELSDALVKIRALISTLNIKNEGEKIELKKDFLEIESTVKKLSQEVNSNLEDFKKVDDLISKSTAVKQELDILKHIDVPLEAFAHYKSLARFTGFVQDKNKAKSIQTELSRLSEKFILFDSPVKRKNFIALFVDSNIKEKVNGVLQKNGFSPVIFTAIGNLEGNTSNNLKKIEEETAKLHNEREKLRMRNESLTQEYKGFLLTAEELLSEQLEMAEAPLMFASTQRTFLIRGWIPTEDLHKSIDRLNKVGKGSVYIQFEPAKKKDKVPVKLKNPKIAKPFEFFLDLYSMPTYKEIDPTFFIFLTFPIFFGIMLGDIGYGLTSLIVFWLLKRKMPKARNFFNVLILASFVSTLFGLFFAEFFGFEIYHPVVGREHEIFKMLFIVLAIGAAHVNIGLIVGFVNIYKDHGLMAAVYEKASWIVLELGVATLALSYFKKIEIHPFVGAVFLLLSFLMLIKGEGIKGLIEFISMGIFTNILSYARLMAIGLSSVVLAVIINDSATEFFHRGGFFILIGVLILIVGHTINIMLGLLGSFLHSLRLHYVEFFSKFFHGSAKKYQPFGAVQE